MNNDIAEIQEVLVKHEVACACVRMRDGRTLDNNCSCRCMRLIKQVN